MITETVFHQLNMGGKVRNAPRISFTGDSEQNFDNPVPKGATALPLDFSFALSTLVIVYLVAKSALKIVTNSATAPVDTIELLPNEPVLWHAKGYGACPFTKDVTGLFVTNPNTSDVELEIHILKCNPQGAPAPAAAAAAGAKTPASAPAPVSKVESPAVSKVEPKPAPVAEKPAAAAGATAGQSGVLPNAPAAPSAPANTATGSPPTK